MDYATIYETAQQLRSFENQMLELDMLDIILKLSAIFKSSEIISGNSNQSDPDVELVFECLERIFSHLKNNYASEARKSEGAGCRFIQYCIALNDIQSICNWFMKDPREQEMVNILHKLVQNFAVVFFRVTSTFYSLMPDESDYNLAAYNQFCISLHLPLVRPTKAEFSPSTLLHAEDTSLLESCSSSSEDCPVCLEASSSSGEFAILSQCCHTLCLRCAETIFSATDAEKFYQHSKR